MSKIDFQPHSDTPQIDFQPHENSSLKLPKPSVMETLAHHIPQGALAGFSDEVAGVGSATANQLGINATQESADEDIGLRPDLAAKPSKVPDYHPSYTEGRDEERTELKKTHDAHPYYSTLGEMAGGLAPAIATGGSTSAAATLGGATGLGSSDQDLANNAPGAVTGTLKDIALGTALGYGGAKAGQFLSNKLNPQKLETAASKSASSALGIKPSKELTTEFNEATGKSMRGSDIIKGTGKTLLENKALPMTGGGEAIYDATNKALAENETKLIPALKSAQANIDQNPELFLNQTGPVIPKAAKVMQDVAGEIPRHSAKDAIIEKLGKQYSEYEQQLAQADGNLEALNAVKKELQSAATLISPRAYEGGIEKYESSLYKRLGGVVRQHIEDLANAANPGDGDIIHQINKTTQNLSTALPYAAKTMDKGVSVGAKDVLLTLAKPEAEAVKIASELATGNPVSRLSNMGAAKTLYGASKAIQTPIGEIVQKQVVPGVAKTVVQNPWTNSLEHSKAQPQESKPPSIKMSGLNESSDLLQKYRDAQESSKPHDSTKLAANLYNATDDSLKSTADQLSKQPGLGFLAQSLKEAIDNKDVGAKNRSIFLILQNPSSRKLVSPEQK